MSAKDARRRTSDGTVRRMVELFAARRGTLALAAALTVGVVVGTLLLPVLTGQAIDCVVGPGEVDFGGLHRALAQIAVTLAATAICQWSLTAVTNRLAFGAVLGLRKRAFDHLQELPLSYLDSHGHGDLASRIVTDADMLTNGLLMAFQQLPAGVLTIVVTLAFMFALNPAIAAVVALLTPISIFTARFIATHSAKHFSGQTRIRGELTAYVEEMVGGISAVETFCQQERVAECFAETDAALGEESFKAVFFSSLVNPTTRFANALVYAAIGIFGAFVAMSGGITVGGLSAFLGYADQYAKPFNDISGVATELQNSVACARRLFALLDEAAEEPDAADASVLADPCGEVEFDHVAFGYDAGSLVLRDVDLAVRPGMRVALVGETGCGKTTLINLLMRFYDVSGGAVRVDGRDVRAWTRESLRAGWGMVLQDTWVRRATVRENVSMGRPDATLEEVRAACREAYADDFICRLPQGYDTVLDGSSALSAGQRQLLCIARVICARPAMLILDEATSNIDTRTELLVQRALAHLMAGRTSFVVAHRLSTVRDADLICVVANGRIAERGTHDELLAAGGRYRRIYEAQFAPTE
ncbi:MAG TPA: ABC transporter ATP-binding protein/permease [Candidatus Olsenella pullistercoris]|uniref:ABC transporter ATP-binding protein/permease n=1 Tax=Candidatus Olsenella pullistercoris TaxID=2838712 RepID=A0A9D2JDD2_9ACTN|nr:ABC transporter ATP-binding protein/permease [Candidatus Olsenella pullistercoris]